MRLSNSTATSNAPRGPRRGFTLLEIFLALTILVAIGAVAMPILSSFMNGWKLKAAADQVRAAWGKARNLAMEKAKPHLFRYQLDGGNFIVEPWSGADAEANAATEAATAADRNTPATNGNEKFSPSPEKSLPEKSSPEKSLPDRIVFLSGGTSSDSRSQRILSTDSAQESPSATSTTPAAAAVPILFFEDGSTSDARVILSNDRQMAVVLELRGLNGTAKVSEIMTLAEAMK